MATFTKIQSFVEAMAEKAHNLGADQLMLAICNTAPLNTNTVLANLTEVAYTFCSSRILTISSSVQTSGTYKQIIADLLLTASGGSIGPFRYICIYNNTATNKELIGFFDYGAAITVLDGETFNNDFDGSAGLMTIV